MKEIKFTAGYGQILSFDAPDFKMKYEERIGNFPGYIQKINGEKKYFAVCPKCDNPAVILGIYRKIDTAPHARHAKGINIPKVTAYNEYKYLHCPYHVKKADYIKEYVPDTEEPERHEIYRIAKEHYDKAVYLLQKKTGIYITLKMAEILAENYADMRAYNYIDATVYNIPWYLIYSHNGFPLYHMIVRKDTVLYRHLRKLGFDLRDSRIKDHVYVADNKGYLLISTNYRYSVDKNEHLNEWLDFSILKPDDKVTVTLLYVAMDRLSVKVDSYYFGSLINYENWRPRRELLDIAERYMNP